MSINLDSTEKRIKELLVQKKDDAAYTAGLEACLAQLELTRALNKLTDLVKNRRM